jgi:GT2 family glycosyltransferase
MEQTTEHHIVVVTVTYGDRWPHLLQVIPAVFQQGIVDQLLIVDNASEYDVATKIRATFPQFLDRILVLPQTENLGSAGGFSTGLKKAYALNADFVYLIDDDNLPEDQALLILYEGWKNVRERSLVALLSFRYQNLPNLKKAAYGEEVRYFHDKPNSFLGFSVTNALAKLNKPAKLHKPGGELLPQVKILQAPYGGLFLPRGTIDRIGFPNEDLYLYADDTEYSYRIIQQGGEILMLTASRLKDLETSWWSDSNSLNKKWSVPLLEEGGFKAYYSTRNLTWFLWKNLSPNPLLFLFNGLIYLGYLLLMAIVSKRMKAFWTILRAVKDGLLGRLGKNMR